MGTTRKTYHSTIKLAFALGIQKEWLPDSFRKSISRSTSHYWKDKSPESFVGYEYASEIKDNIEEVKLIYDDMLRRERQLFIAYSKLKQTLFNIIGQDTIKEALKAKSHELVKTVEQVKETLGGVPKICKNIGLKARTYTYWKDILKHRCSLSPVGICLKRVPNQATADEIGTIKRLLKASKFSNWPICSVWAYAVREGLAYLSLSSWYRYNRKFGFREKIKKGKFKPKYTPLRAPRPNHTWHADITIVKTLDDVKHYVYLIVDNYSKHIINWRVHDKVCGKVRMETIQEAIKQEFGDNVSTKASLDLVVDGGSENNNVNVETYLKQCQVDIDKQVALKDIQQSNSMVEASNKILKHQYLFREAQRNREDLEYHLETAIYDYCYERPNYTLGIQTPYEAHKGIVPPNLQNIMFQSVKERVRINKNSSCDTKCD